MDQAAEQRTYQKAADIADVLLSRGIPVLKYADLDGGAKIGMVFQLTGDAAKYAVRCPVDEASVEWFEAAYRRVA